MDLKEENKILHRKNNILNREVKELKKNIQLYEKLKKLLINQLEKQ